jgi:hypothetical protein
MMQLQQGFATGEMGAGVRGQFGLHDSNSKPLMSALGQLRHLGHAPTLPQYPRKPTFACAAISDAAGHERTVH